MEIKTKLNEAQSLIYCRSNLRRAFDDFDDTDIAGISLVGDNVCITRTDGTSQEFPREKVCAAFTKFTNRLPNFFAYLGPNYRGPSAWRDNGYVLFKGWSYTHSLGERLNPNARFQARFADQLIHFDTKDALLSVLQNEQFDIGYLIAPDGFHIKPRLLDLDGDFNEEQEEQASFGEPYCSCGSFHRQLNHLQAFKEEIPHFKPRCKHLSWVEKYREFISKRSQIRIECNDVPEKCVAWWYAPPEDGNTKGRMTLIHTKSGVNAPLSHWRHYRKGETFTEDDSWELFDNMLEAGYVPYPGDSLQQLKHIWKKGG